MKKIKVLNLYACLGGNRYKWPSDLIEVTAVELDPELIRLYKQRFPGDTVIQSDAHQYLLDNFKSFDFIWSSPPCPTHSRVRMSQKTTAAFKPMYPDMKLYEEIIFLEAHFKGKWVVENVIPYYKPLISANKRGRHLYWSNFKIPHDLNLRKLGGSIGLMKDEIKALSKFHDFDFYQYKGEQRRDKIARNLVDYEAGAAIFNAARGIMQQAEQEQTSLF